MNALIEQINSIVQNNQVLSTVAGGSIVVWVVSNLKSIYNRIVESVTALISFTIVNTYTDNRGGGGGWCISDEQHAFNRLVSNSKALWERTKNLDLSGNGMMVPDGDMTEQANLTYGFSLRLLLGKLVTCHRSIETGQKVTVHTTLRVFFASKKKFMKSLENGIENTIKNIRQKASKRDSIEVCNLQLAASLKYKRTMDSIFTNNNEHRELLDSIKNFLDNKETYRKLSYPYSYSALLHGKPGCGKSSTILAIASELDKNIYYVNLSKISVESLRREISCGGSDSILVFEDIDALTIGASKRRVKGTNPPCDRSVGSEDEYPCIPEYEENDERDMEVEDGEMPVLGMSLSDILNFTDGLLASDGTICLFTTNHIERLDPALLRAGRMNKIVEFTDLNAATAARAIKANLGMEVHAEDLKETINPAVLQSEILNVAVGRQSEQEFIEKFLRERRTR